MKKVTEYDVLVRVEVYGDETLDGVLAALQRYGPCTNVEVVKEVEVAA